MELEGVVRASRYSGESSGKQFLGAILECEDEREWVISYGEQSPYHAFADRCVRASGEPYKPDGQGQYIWRRDGQLGHFRVSTMRLVEVTPDAALVEVGAPQELNGEFNRRRSDTGETTLLFVAKKRGPFRVVNDPAGMTFGRSVEVLAYPVLPSPSFRSPSEQYLWVICPCSTTELWEWRGRR